MRHGNPWRLQSACSVCDGRSLVPVLLLRFWSASAGYETRYWLCFYCGWEVLKSMKAMRDKAHS